MKKGGHNSEHPSIHPSIFLTCYPILCRIGAGAYFSCTPWIGRYLITGLTRRDRQSFTLTFVPIATLESPVKITYWEPTQAQREHVNSTLPQPYCIADERLFCCSSVAIEVKAWQYMSTIMMTSHYTDSVILYSLQENHLYNWRSKKQPQKGKKIFFLPSAPLHQWLYVLLLFNFSNVSVELLSSLISFSPHWLLFPLCEFLVFLRSCHFFKLVYLCLLHLQSFGKLHHKKSWNID